MSNKILKILFVVLLIVTAAELIYYLFILSQPTQKLQMQKNAPPLEEITSKQNTDIGTGTNGDILFVKDGKVNKSYFDSNEEAYYLVIDNKEGDTVQKSYIKPEFYKYIKVYKLSPIDLENISENDTITVIEGNGETEYFIY